MAVSYRDRLPPPFAGEGREPRAAGSYARGEDKLSEGGNPHGSAR